MRLISLIAVLLCSSFLTQECFALAQESVGPVPKAHAQPGWPSGLVELLRHPSRAYSIWVNGNENIYYKADAKQINELIKQFSATRMRDHVVTIKVDSPAAKSFKGDMHPYNVNLHILSGIALSVYRGKGSTETFEPTLTICVDPDKDAELLKQISLPRNIILKNEVPDYPLMGGKAKPERAAWFANIQFDDGKPACDFNSGVWATIHLWEKKSDKDDSLLAPIRLGQVSHLGVFHAPFSKQEMADLKSGKIWLTMTVGNWLTKAKPEHPRVDIEKLSKVKEFAEVITIAKPRYYHGRLLFEDGSPPKLDPPPWPGAKIRINFPYAGTGKLDDEGYFQVYFTAEQMAAMKERKPRKNIYVPSYKEKNRSSALHVFPVSKLSTKKEEAGVVQIPHPAPAKDNDEK